MKTVLTRREAAKRLREADAAMREAGAILLPPAELRRRSKALEQALVDYSNAVEAARGGKLFIKKDKP